MNTRPLDIYDDMPDGMKSYISNFGWHFTKKSYEYAVSFMKKSDKGNYTSSPVKEMSKDEIDTLLSRFGVTLENKIMYDYVFVATMCKADYYGSCIEDDYHLCLYVKDTVDDVDASDETVFRRWVATMVGNGKPIDWYDII